MTVYLRPNRALKVRYSQNYQGSNFVGTVVHFLVSPAQGMCSNPEHQPKIIMYLLNGVFVKVQTSHLSVH